MEEKEGGNRFVGKSAAHGLFQFDERGVFRIGGLAAYMMPMPSLVIQNRLLSTHLDDITVRDIHYYTGKIQGIVSVKLLRDKFGVKSIKDVFYTTLDQLGMIGLGKNKVMRFSQKERSVILKKDISPYEDIYRIAFGYQRNPIGHFHRGAIAGMLGELFGEEMVAVEKKCRAQGQESCIEEAFPLSQVGSRKLTHFEKLQLPSPESRYPEINRLKSVSLYLKY